MSVISSTSWCFAMRKSSRTNGARSSENGPGSPPKGMMMFCSAHSSISRSGGGMRIFATWEKSSVFGIATEQLRRPREHVPGRAPHDHADLLLAQPDHSRRQLRLEAQSPPLEELREGVLPVLDLAPRNELSALDLELERRVRCLRFPLVGPGLEEPR